MIKLLEKQELLELKSLFDEFGYRDEELKKRFRVSRPPNRDEYTHVQHLCAEVNTLNTLVRLFLLGESIGSAQITPVLPSRFYHLCTDAGLLATRNDGVHANVVIVPVEELLFVSDAFALLGTPGAKDFVLPASTHAANFLRYTTLYAEARIILDLGTGCGIQALFAAAHGHQVVATDISARAIKFTQFNTLLNGVENIEYLTGDLFEPVTDRTFDLIVSNPPFVLGPGQEFVYRDNNLELDEFCRHLLRLAPNFLNDGGHFQMLCEWVEIDGESWQQRLTNWIQGTGCDGWILHSPPLTPPAYAQIRLMDVSGPGHTPGESYDTWVEYFESHGVRAIHPGMILLRKRNGKNWLHLHSLPSDVKAPVGEAIRQSMAACDALNELNSDEALLKAYLQLPSELTLEQRFARAEDHWRPTTARLRLDHGIPIDAEVDIPIMALLNQFDGTTTTADCIAKFASTTGANEETLRQQALPALRVLIERGFLKRS